MMLTAFPIMLPWPRNGRGCVGLDEKLHTFAMEEVGG